MSRIGRSGRLRKEHEQQCDQRHGPIRRPRTWACTQVAHRSGCRRSSADAAQEARRPNYEVRVNGRLPERARGVACDAVTSVPTQTIVLDELAEPSDLGDLLHCAARWAPKSYHCAGCPTRRRPARAHPPGRKARRASAATPGVPPSRPSGPVESSAARASLGRRSGSPPRRGTRQMSPARMVRVDARLPSHIAEHFTPPHDKRRGHRGRHCRDRPEWVAPQAGARPSVAA
jgi:hypothetical protein